MKIKLYVTRLLLPFPSAKSQKYRSDVVEAIKHQNFLQIRGPAQCNLVMFPPNKRKHDPSLCAMRVLQALRGIAFEENSDIITSRIVFYPQEYPCCLRVDKSLAGIVVAEILPKPFCANISEYLEAEKKIRRLKRKINGGTSK